MITRGLVTILLVLSTALATDRPESNTLSPPNETVARPLPFFYDLYTFRGSEDSTTIVATIAVPVGELRRERSQNQVNYRFDLRLVLADTARRSVSNTEDSVFLSVPRPLRRQHLLHTHVEVHALPSSTTVQRLVVTDAAKAKKFRELFERFFVHGEPGISPCEPHTIVRIARFELNKFAKCVFSL